MNLKNAKDELTPLAERITQLARARKLKMVPAVPIAGQAGKVLLEADDISTEDFLDLAAAAGQKLAYLESSLFEADDLARLDEAAHDEDLDAELRRRITALRTTATRFIGWPAGLEMAFVCEGVIHCWSAEAAWYADFEAEVAAALPCDADEFDEPLSDKDREAVVERLAQELVALPEFKAAGSEGSWRRVARAHLASPDCDPSPLEELPDHLIYAVTRRAADQVMAETQRRYAGAEQGIHELAQQIAADPLYRTARTAPARKHRVRDHLMAQADGYSPPTRVLDLLLDALATGRTSRPDPGPTLPFTSD